jgi:hypothetical protein
MDPGQKTEPKHMRSEETGNPQRAFQSWGLYPKGIEKSVNGGPELISQFWISLPANGE